MVHLNSGGDRHRNLLVQSALQAGQAVIAEAGL